MKKSFAIKAIDQAGLLLVFPIDNAPEPRSLWSVAYPRSKMRWEWDDNGDNRVGDLWHLREQLSSSGKVVYTKWYRGRATFLSRELFTAMLSLNMRLPGFLRINREAKGILDELMESSPLSTKQLKRASNLLGRALEPTYQRALKQLYERLLIVAYGEVDEGAFPSLAIAATRLIFEELFEEAKALTPSEAQAVVEKYLKPHPLLWRQHGKMLKQLDDAAS